MPLVKIYAQRETLDQYGDRLIDAIEDSLEEGLGVLRGHSSYRLFRMEPKDFRPPAGRSAVFTIIEIILMQGRNAEQKKRVIRRLLERLPQMLEIDASDLEIQLIDLPPCNFGFRGSTGDGAVMDYEIGEKE